MKALVIDDSRAVRMILRKYLQDLGFEVVEAEDGQQALDRLSEFPDIALALVDWNMPVMTGLEFVKRVRSNMLYQDIKLMMVTTEAELDRVVLALESGADEYVMKPFTQEIIEEKLQILGCANQGDA